MTFELLLNFNQLMLILEGFALGTNEERGLGKREAAAAAQKVCRDKTYDLPFGMSIIEK